MLNLFDKNKRIYPEPCLVSLKPAITPIALPPADTKTDEDLDAEQKKRLIGQRIRVNSKQKIRADKTPHPMRGADIAGMTGIIKQFLAEDVRSNYVEILLDQPSDGTNWRVHFVTPEEIDLIVDGQGSQANPPVKDGWESQDDEPGSPMQQFLRWPDGGMHMASSNTIYPREDDQETPPVKKIHSFGLTEDLENTSIDLATRLCDTLVEGLASQEEDDDQNSWGDIDNVLDGSVESEDTKYGPGNYPDETPSSPAFHHNLVVEDREPFTWVVPKILAAGPHPIFTSHMDNLTPLKDAGFKAIISVFDKPLDPKLVRGFHYFFIPTLEGFSTELTSICRFIDSQAKLHNPIFIHSLHGRGRAAAVLAAYFVHSNYLVADEAINYVRQYYDREAIETTAQEDAIIKFALEP